MRFSVIIPLYNKASYIQKAICSVLSQTYRDYELIVVDDGSLDDGVEKVKSLLKTDNKLIELNEANRFCLIDECNAGVSTARNNGVAQSQGSYVCFLDADDWWHPQYLEKMSMLIEKYPEAGIYGCNYYLVRNKTNKIAPIALDDDFDEGYIDYFKVYGRRLCMPLTSITVAISRNIFEEMQGFKTNLKLGEDFDLWLRIALKYKVAFQSLPLAYYNQDVDFKNRAIGKLQDPQTHILWNLSYLWQVEMENNDLKVLLDNMRVYSLYPYYLSRKYHDAAKTELKKVDWNSQCRSIRIKYRLPLFYSRFIYKLRKRISCFKRMYLCQK